MASSFNLAAWFNRYFKQQRQLQDTAQTFILEPIYTPSGLADGGDDGEGVELPSDNVIDDLEASSSDSDSSDTSSNSSDDTDSEPATADSEEAADFDEDDVEELPYIDDIEDDIETEGELSETTSEAMDAATTDETADDTEADGTSDDDTEDAVAADNLDAETTSSNETEDSTETSIAEDDAETDVEDDAETEATLGDTDSGEDADAVSADEPQGESEDTEATTTSIDESDAEDDSEISDESEDAVTTTNLDGETSPEDSEGEADIVAEDDGAKDEVDGDADPEATAEDEELDEEDEEILDETPAFQLPSFDSGVFTVGDSGEVGVDFLYDGGKYQGDVGIFSLSGFDELELNSIEDFIAEAANRAASGSEQGHIVISDASEGAKFDGSLAGGEDWNSGGYRDVKTFTMKAGDKFAVMLVPDGSVSEVASHPEIGGAKRPLFSLSTANPNDEFHMNQLVDVTGDGNTFVMEDIRTDASSDKDYNDLIFQVRGATGEATYIGEVIDAEDDWRTQDLGKALIAYADPYITPEPVEADAGESVDVTDGVEEVESESDEAVTDEASSVEVEDSQPGSEAEVEVTQAEDAQAETVDEIETEAVDDTDVEVTDTVEETPTQEAQGETVDETDADTEQPATTTAETEATESGEGDFSQGFELGDEPQDTAESGFVPPTFEFPKEDQPDIGIIDTGVAANNPDLDYDNITLGTDLVDGDDNPLLAEGEGNEHGTHALGIIAAEQDNGEGIDGINDDAPIWVGRAVGSGKWAESLVEFVDHAKESGQPNAVVNLSMDLTQVDADGNVTTRYELTPQEREAIEYARQNNVMIVAAAGNDGGVMSALGQASQEFDNIMTVGAAEQFDPDTSAWKGADRTNYSSYGQSLDITAYGGTMENPQLSLAGEGTSGMAGTSVATAKVTGAVSQVWAANPELSYRQVVDIIRDTATDLGSTGDDAETGAGLLNMTAAVHLAKVTKPEEHSTPALLSPETWSGEGVFTPDERAVQNVVVPPVWRRQYHGWLDSSNPSDTFAFRIDEETSLQYSIDFPGNAVLRKNGRVILKGKYDGNITYAGANGKLSPGSYTLTVDRHGLPVESYKLILNFIDGSHGQQTPVIEWLPAKPVVQPQPTPTPTPTPTPSPSPEEVAAKKRAADKVRAVYEANRDRLGNSLQDIQIFEQAFDGVNMPAVQYFEGGYIIWNGQKAIPYFTGTGKALPNIDLPSTVKPIWDVVKPSNVVNVPDGRHTYPNMRGSSEYWVELDGDKNDISLAARDTSLAHPDLRTTVYRDLGGGQLQQVPLTDINPDDNYLNYKDLPDGKYLIKVDVEQNKANVPYEMVVNLDQAGDTGIKAWNINRESVSGQLAGQRIVRSDHVGLPSGDRDLYVFTTDDMATELRFAVRSQDSDGSEAERQRLLDGDVRVRILDEGGKQIGKPVDSKSRQPLFGAQWLEPNSKYYAEVTALNGTKTNYDVVLNFDKLKADGRYEFTNLQGEFDYEFTVDGTNRDLKTAVRSKNGQDMSNIYRPVLYRKVNGTERFVSPTSTANGISHYETLPKGHYRMVADPILAVHPHLLNQKYTFVHNLDQAGQHRSDARDLGNIGGKRVTKNDFVGKDRTDEVDYYKFSTGSDPYLLQFAVRHGSRNDNLRLEGDVEFALYDKNGKELKKVNSSNLKSIYGTYELKPNSEYYVRVKDKSGDGDGGNYHLVLNAEVKRNTGGGGSNYLQGLTAWTNWQWEDSINSAADFSYIKSNPSSNIGKLWRDLSKDLLGAYFPPSGAYISDDYNNVVTWMNSYHGGIDFGGVINNQPVKSLVNGTVALSTNHFGTLTILGEDGRYYIYKHLSSRYFSKGQTVKAGQVLGRVGGVGANGATTFDPHLHFEVSKPPYTYGAAHSPSVLHSKAGIRQRNYNPVKAYWELKRR